MKTLIALAFVACLALSGCVVNLDKAVFKSSNSAAVPDISGAYTNDQKETYLVQLKEGTTNTFVATPPDKKNPMTVVIEPLKTSGRFILQLQNPQGPEVVMTVAAIENKKVTVYDLNTPELPKVAAKYGVKMAENNITEYKSVDKLKEFFEACFTPELSAVAVTVGAGSPIDGSKSGGKSKKKN